MGGQSYAPAAPSESEWASDGALEEGTSPPDAVFQGEREGRFRKRFAGTEPPVDVEPVVELLWDEYYFKGGLRPSAEELQWARIENHAAFISDQARRLRGRVYAKAYEKIYWELWNEAPKKSDARSHGQDRVMAEELLVRQVQAHFRLFEPLVKSVPRGYLGIESARELIRREIAEAPPTVRTNKRVPLL